jgi:hypothetical protein
VHGRAVASLEVISKLVYPAAGQVASLQEGCGLHKEVGGKLVQVPCKQSLTTGSMRSSRASVPQMGYLVSTVNGVSITNGAHHARMAWNVSSSSPPAVSATTLA